MQALRILSQTEWNLEPGVTAYFNEAEEIAEQGTSSESQPSAPQPIPTTSNMPPPPTQPPKKKFSTLGDLSSGGAGAGHAGHGHDGEDSDDSDENQNLYTGGEKSGLAVSNPDDLKKKIIERAKKYFSMTTSTCTVELTNIP